MSNSPCPVDPNCDHRGYTGCTSCGCSECGALDTGTLGPLELAPGLVVQACAECRAAGEEDETVETRTLSDAELMALKEAV